MSEFSTTSKNSFPSAPIVWTVMAMMAAMGPIDRIAVKRPAMTISGKARMISIVRRGEPAHRAGADEIGGGEEAEDESECCADDGRDQRDVDGDDELVDEVGDVEAVGDVVWRCDV
jgi:hypothetical protein